MIPLSSYIYPFIYSAIPSLNLFIVLNAIVSFVWCCAIYYTMKDYFDTKLDFNLENRMTAIMPHSFYHIRIISDTSCIINLPALHDFFPNNK